MTNILKSTKTNHTSLEQRSVAEHIEKLIDLLDDKSINELFSVCERDMNKVWDILYEETSNILYFGGKELNQTDLNYLPNLKAGYEEYLRKANLNYFVCSVLPDFEMNWHCFGKGVEVRMYDGSIKNIEDIQVGDQVMGPDSTPRNVLKLFRGKAPLYKINSTGGVDSYIATDKHDIVLWTKSGELIKKKPIEIPERKSSTKIPSKWHDMYSQLIVGYTKSNEQQPFVEPYFLGLWLGDGISSDSTIACADSETVEYLKEYAARLNMDLVQNETIKWRIKKREGKDNYLRSALRNYNLLNNKHVPLIYFSLSEQDRLELLAGFIDSDGNLTKGNTFVCSNVNEKLIKDMQNIAFSLGFRATLNCTDYKFKKATYNNKPLWILCISGDIYKIPTKIERKKSTFVNDKRDWRRSNIRNVEFVGEGEYFGFECDKDHLFLLKNGMIVANCTEWFQMIQLYQYLCIIAARDHCFGKDTEVRMYDGSVKKIQDIQVGDQVMGPDSTPRNVLKIHKGIDELYNVKSVKNAHNYVVNSLHDIVLFDRKNQIHKKKAPELIRSSLCKYDYAQKVVKEGRSNKVGIDVIEPLGTGEYFGFECDGDHLFLLKDGMIVSNSKSYSFSFATILWKMYRYEKATEFYSPSLEVKLCKEGMLITNEYKLAKRLIKKIRREIEDNPILNERLYPGAGADGWANESLTCSNGAELTLSSYRSPNRGPHPGYIVVDDFLDKSCLYSKEARNRFHEVFQAEIMNMILPKGQVLTVGCLHGDSWILTKEGLRRIKTLNPTSNSTINETVPFKKEIWGKDGFENTSHYHINGLTNTKKIVLQNGYSLECSLIHPLWTPDGWKQSQNLKIGELVGLKIGGGFGNYKQISLIPFIESQKDFKGKELSLPNYVNEDLAYLIGLWVAEGSYEKIGRINITNKDEEIISFLNSSPFGLKFSQWSTVKFTYSVQSVKFLNLLKYLGCPLEGALNKDVPTKIMECSDPFVIKAFLQGLYDGDGSCYTSKTQTQIHLGSISESLIKNVQQLLLQFGIISCILKRKPAESYLAKGKYPLYVLCCVGQEAESFLDKIGFRLTRKQKDPQRKVLSKRIDDIKWLKIKSIEDSQSYTFDFVIPKTHNFISNGIISHNTPFHSQDLYSQLKLDPSWKVFEYPAIFPDGRVLWESRYDYDALVKKRQSLGNLIFSREILTRPISDSISIFPYNILELGFMNMQSISLVSNRESYPIKMKKVSLGCDFALSGSAKADYSVFSVWGIDFTDSIHLMHLVRLHGSSYNEQLSYIGQIANDFNPEVVVMEVNGFQKVMAQLAKDRGIRNVIEFNTNGFNKKDLYTGLPSLAVLFETGIIKLPRGNAESIAITDMLCHELNSMAFDGDSGKLESISGHDDIALSAFFAIKGLKTVHSDLRISYVE